MRRALASLLVLAIGCFDPENGPSTSGGAGTDTAEDTTMGTTDASTMSATGMSATSATTTGETDSPTSTTNPPGTSEESGDPACGGGQQCLEIPGGWMGPFIPELGAADQCDDASIPVMYAGTDAAFDRGCSCDCGGSSQETCVMEVLLGGVDPVSCTDNDEVAATCTFELPSGALDCGGDSSCVPTEGEAANMNSYRVCGPVTDDTLTPSFTGGYRLCDADDVVGSPCDGGQCVDGSAAACVAREGDNLDCPAAFPNAIVGFQGFDPAGAACGCECADEADCGYIGWWETDDACPGGSDDDPACSNGGVAVGMQIFLTPAGTCTPVNDSPEDPEIPFADPLTVCCTVEL